MQATEAADQLMTEDTLISSDDERELQEEEKEKFEVSVQITGALPAKVKAVTVFP